jgi:ABC-2 type transport system permease protein
MGAAFSCGLERIVIPFFTAGNPVEYELIRAINTVTKPQRKTVGIVQTDALPMGDVIAREGRYVQVPPLQVIYELAKQYNVELVQADTEIPLWLEDDAGQPIGRRYDALVVIQPSKMAPVELDNLLTAIQQGQPTAIFEDPFTYCFREADPMSIFQGNHPPYNQNNLPAQFPGTTLPRPIDRLGRQACDIQKLWDLLGVFVIANKVQGQTFPAVIWKIDNPYKQTRALDQPELFIVHDSDERQPNISRDDPATQGILELYFPYPGQIDEKPGGGTEFQPLVTSGNAGKVSMQALLSPSPRELEIARGNPDGEYVFAARITKPAPEGEAGSTAAGTMNVIYVADIDFLADGFVMLRNDPSSGGIRYNFDNVAFFNNIVDSLTGETEYLATRSRRIRHATLRYVEETTNAALEQVSLNEQEFEKEFGNQVTTARQQLQAEIDPQVKSVQELEAKQRRGENIDQQTLQVKRQNLKQTLDVQQAKLNRVVQDLTDGLNENKRRIRLDAEIEIQEIQRQFKLAAVILPVVPPLLLGLFVYTRRRLREREGISKARRIK